MIGLDWVVESVSRSLSPNIQTMLGCLVAYGVYVFCNSDKDVPIVQTLRRNHVRPTCTYAYSQTYRLGNCEASV